jgi:hypothetical protein
MDFLSKSQLDQFMRTLQMAENAHFNSTNKPPSKNQLINPKLEKLDTKKIKLLNKLKYDVMALVNLLDEIENEKTNPSKVKVVGV